MQLMPSEVAKLKKDTLHTMSENGICRAFSPVMRTCLKTNQWEHCLRDCKSKWPTLFARMSQSGFLEGYFETENCRTTPGDVV